MPSVNRKLDGMSGKVSCLLIGKNGFYLNSFSGKVEMPVGLPFRRKLFGLYLELCLRLRLFFKGAWRGLHGTGVIGVGRVYASIIRATGGVEHLGLISTKVITNAGVTFLRDDWNNNGQDFTTMNFHACGTGVVAENVTDTGMGTEQTTNLNPASTRATGTRSVPSSNTFASVGTLTFSGAAAVTEQGVMSASATGTGSLWDRSVFAAINVSTADSIQFTYTGTLSAGG